MYVSASINGHAIRILLNTETTHNFISKDEAKRQSLKVTKEECTMKTVNSPTKLITSTAQGVRVTLGILNEKLNFSIVPMRHHEGNKLT